MNQARWRDTRSMTIIRKMIKEGRNSSREYEIPRHIHAFPSHTQKKKTKNARASTPFHSHTTTSLPLTQIKVKIEALKGRWLLLIDIRGLKKKKQKQQLQ